jgi:tetratricopeptide (TPR) repeat protein
MKFGTSAGPFFPRLWLVAVLVALSGPAWADAVGEAQRLLEQRRLPEALGRVDAALAANARDPRGRFLRGLILTEMGRRDEAVGVFQQLTVDFPELAEPYNNLAVLHAQQGRLDQARAALELAVRLQPKNAMAFENLGDVYVRLAGQAYDQASQINPRAASVQTKLKLLRELAPPASQRP